MAAGGKKKTEKQLRKGKPGRGAPTTRELTRAEEKAGERVKEGNIPGRSKDPIRALMDARRSKGNIVSETETPYAYSKDVTAKFKKGGCVGDGCAIRGRTKGRMV